MTRRRGLPTLADLDHALDVVGYVIKHHPLGRNALPIFERLERERRELARKGDLLDRATAFSGAEGGIS